MERFSSADISSATALGRIFVNKVARLTDKTYPYHFVKHAKSEQYKGTTIIISLFKRQIMHCI